MVDSASAFVVGDFSGLQDYLFDVAEEGGGQARRLRARSFRLQLLAEAAAIRFRRAAGWTKKEVVFCNASKFVLFGPALSPDQIQRIDEERITIEKWLLRQLLGSVRFSLVVEVAGSTRHSDAFERATWRLQREKLRAWATVLINDGSWNQQQLILAPIETPCALCRRRTGDEIEKDVDTGLARQVCRWCSGDLAIGRSLPSAKWLSLRETDGAARDDVMGFELSLSQTAPASDDRVVAWAALEPNESIPRHLDAARRIERSLLKRIPSDGRRPREFVELAQEARGDALLAALKMDVDSLGIAFQRTLRETDLDGYRNLSAKLDRFFSSTLDREMGQKRWSSLYLVFSGGDDFLLVGPWDVALDFAGHARKLFAEQFKEEGLTLSTGIAFFKPKRPIAHAVVQAEDALEEAKTKPAVGASTSKDQCAALGAIWKWNDHDRLLEAGKRLADWVERKAAKRGWLHTLLTLAEARAAGDLLATARLAYHVARNYPRGEFCDWAEEVLDDFDKVKQPRIACLPAILRYALAATRASEKEG